MLRLAIIGRPNVGKSTLFNKLVGKHLAIVDDTPGVTRDWREAQGTLFGRPLILIDTAGLEESFDESIQGRMRKQTEAALAQADCILFVIDGHSGVTPADEHFAAFIRKQKKPVILAVNKCENAKTTQSAIGEAYALGFGEPLALSAAHSIGFEDIFHALEPYLGEDNTSENSEIAQSDDFGDIDSLEGQEDFDFVQSEEEEEETEKSLKIAIIGRPNVGKSTLLNAIVKQERVMTGPEAGTTRDAVSVDWTYADRNFRLVDTAGMRKKSKIQNVIEKLSVEDSLRAVRLAHLVILVLDANAALEKQDLQLADHVIGEGRAIIVAVNKWETVENRSEKLEEIRDKLETSLAQTRDIPVVTLSALNGRNIERLLDVALETYEIWNKRIATSGLNRWLGRMESQNPPPLVGGRPNRLKYITQIKTRPPTFALWVSKPQDLPDTYRRYIINGLRKDYGIPGVPVRLLLRASKNPFKN